MEHTIAFTMQYGTFKATAGDKYGELVLQDGWYVVEKFNDRTSIYGPIDTEALAIMVTQDVRSTFHQAVEHAKLITGAE